MLNLRHKDIYRNCLSFYSLLVFVAAALSVCSGCPTITDQIRDHLTLHFPVYGTKLHP